MRIGCVNASKAPVMVESNPQTTEGYPSPVTSTRALVLAYPFCTREKGGPETESHLPRHGSQGGLQQGCEARSCTLGPGLSEPLGSRCCLGWGGCGHLEAQGREEGTAMTVALGVGRGSSRWVFGVVAGDECVCGAGASGKEYLVLPDVAPTPCTVPTCHLSWP